MVAVIPTGVLSLDIALGIGGFPCGHLIEIFGPEGSGKTTLCLHTVAEAQKLGGTAAYLDMDQALDPAYAARLGVDIENLLVTNVEDPAEAMDIAGRLTRSRAVDVIVVDSMAAMVERAGIGRSVVGTGGVTFSRWLAPALRMLAGTARQSGATVIFVNEQRERGGWLYGVSQSTPGGMGLKVNAAIRVEINGVGVFHSGNEVIGMRTRAQVVKNKLAKPLRATEFNIMYNGGVARLNDLFDLAIEFGLIKTLGRHYSYDDIDLGQGRQQACASLSQNAALVEELEINIRTQCNLY
jgi:recombination protein RecA